MADFGSDTELRLETRTHILDHLAWTAIERIFELWHIRGGSLRQDQILPDDLKPHLQAVDSFTTVYETSYGEEALTPLVRYRLRLLRFVSLFVLRNVWSYTPVLLEQVRLNNWERVHKLGRFSGYLKALDIAFCKTSAQATSTADNRTARNECRDSEEVESQQLVNPQHARLLDLLPSFVNIIDARVDIHVVSDAKPSTAEALHLLDFLEGPEGHPRPPLDLIAEFALQACLDQFKFHLACDASPIIEAFSWGSYDRSDTEIFDTGLAAAKRVFQDSSSYDATRIFDAFPGTYSGLVGQQTFTWPVAYQTHLANLGTIVNKSLKDNRTPDESFYENLELDASKISDRFPEEGFENDMVAFLRALHKGLDVPLLVAIEQGIPAAVDGIELDEEDLRRLRVIAGLETR